MAQANLKIISTAYPIEKGVPLPETVAGNVGGRPWKYPFLFMKVGDSFVMDAGTSKATAIVASHAKRHPGAKFTTRSIDAGNTRIWRIK
jgi:hypothetical protein